MTVLDKHIKQGPEYVLEEVNSLYAFLAIASGYVNKDNRTLHIEWSETYLCISYQLNIYCCSI